MKVTAWNNGKHHVSGAGYGFKLTIKDRDTHFKRFWKSVEVKLPSGETVEANINKDSFWATTCRELICKQFGAWLHQTKLAPWEKGNPPRFELVSKGGNKFELTQT